MKNKQVVVCSQQLTADAIMDFLTEFYAHPKLEVRNEKQTSGGLLTATHS